MTHMSSADVRAWTRFLCADNPEDAASFLNQLIKRLDDAFDAVNHVRAGLVGSPDIEAAEVLRDARLALEEGLEILERASSSLRNAEPVEV